MIVNKLAYVSPPEQDLVIEIARAMLPYEKEIAHRWHELYIASEKVHRARERTVRSFTYAVRMLLTSLEDGDFTGYLQRIYKAGVSFARTKEKYENLILFLHFYEESITPYLRATFPDKIDVVLRTLEHLYHGLVAIMSQAYFMELEKDRENFLSTLVHDLRNPLIGMTGFARIMMEKNVPKEKEDRLLKIIRDSGKKMSSLIDHAMTYGRLKNGKACWVGSDVDVVQCAREAATMLLPEVEKNNLTVLINGQRLKNWDYLSPVVAYADRELLLRVVGNYLSNAIKHAKTKIAVAVQEETGTVYISVKDDGPGIPPDKQQLIFENYYVVPGGKPGTGIGLASVRMIANLCKGRAWVESDCGRGCAFFFSLPAERQEHKSSHA